jgi:hypothetical protein
VKGRKNFFFEKKKQKTFIHGVRPTAQSGGTYAGRNGQKFFGAFFQKRTFFFDLPTRPNPVK